MASEVRRSMSVIEILPHPDELDRKFLPKLMLDAIQEIKDEIDALGAALGDKQRAAEPWDSDKAFEDYEKLKAKISAALKKV